MATVSRRSPEHPPASNRAALCSDSGSGLVPLEGQAELARAESPLKLLLRLGRAVGARLKRAGCHLAPRSQPASSGRWCLRRKRRANLGCGPRVLVLRQSGSCFVEMFTPLLERLSLTPLPLCLLLASSFPWTEIPRHWVRGKAL